MKTIHLPLLIPWLLVTPALAQSMLPATNPKVSNANAVFQQLNYAFGSGRSTGLRLEILARNPRKKPIIAQYNPRPAGAVVRLDEEVYDLCRTLGPDSLNALAAVLGHELAHHHLNHSWYDTFGLSGTTGVTINKEQASRFETEADFNGCFVAQLCGYSPDPAFKNILALIDTHIVLPNGRHASRPQAYTSKTTQLTELAAVFRVAQLLYATGQFDAAAVCFQRLTNADAFPNAPMLNNLAVCYLQAYAAKLSAADQPFALPIEFDANGRLAAPRSRGETPSPALLSAAIRTLETALSTEPDYSPARLNLACAYLLNQQQKQYSAALGEIDKLKPAQRTAESWLVQAIAYHLDGLNDRATIAFQQARQQKQSASSAAIVAYNQKVFESRTGSVLDLTVEWLRKRLLGEQNQSSQLITTERVSGQAVETVRLPTSQATTVVIEGFDQNRQRPITIEWRGSSLEAGVLAGQLRTSVGQSIRLLVAGPAYRGQLDRRLGIGATEAQLRAAYGLPVRQCRQTSGSWWVYESASKKRQLIVELTTNDRIQGWIVTASP